MYTLDRRVRTFGIDNDGDYIDTVWGIGYRLHKAED
jgi:DNA-binding response OmpR family regulator